MAYVIPPWLQPVSPVQPFLSGVSQGADIAGQQNRMELAIQEMTLRREAQQRHDEAQQLAAARTVQDMAAQQQVMAQKAREAALKWEGQKEYGDLVAQGVSPAEAFGRTAHKLIPGQLGQFITGQERQRQAIANQAAIDARERERMAETKRYHDLMLGKSSVPPTIETVRNPVTGEDVAIARLGGRSQVLTAPPNTQDKQLKAIEDESLKSQQRQLEKSIEETMDQRERASLQDELLKVKTARSNLVMAAKSKPVPEESWDKYAPSPEVLDTALRQTRDMGITTPTNAPSVSTKRVRVRSKSGKVGTIPESQLDEALKEGYTLVD